MTAQPARAASKLLGLEIIRFVCAVAVLLYHYQHFSYVANKATGLIRHDLPMYSVFALFYEYGFYGVQIFWCISGFIFFWKYRDAVANRVVGPRRFFVLRFSRLYPLHLVTLLLVAALQLMYFGAHKYYFVYQSNDLKHFILQIFLASNWGLQNGDSFNGPIWSISVEVVVYCVFFCVLRFLGRSAWINFAVVIACALAKFNGVANPVSDCLAFFYAGGLAAMAYLQTHSVLYKRRIDGALVIVMLATAGLVVATKLYWAPAFPYFYLLLTMPVVLYLFSRPVQLPHRLEALIAAAGNMTYSSYLIHFPLQLITAIACSRIGVEMQYYRPWFLAAYLSVTLVLAWWVFKYFEMPAQDRVRAAVADGNGRLRGKPHGL